MCALADRFEIAHIWHLDKSSFSFSHSLTSLGDDGEFDLGLAPVPPPPPTRSEAEKVS